MSTRSVGRSTATQENVRSTATPEVDRSAVTPENVRSAVTRKNVRSAAANEVDCSAATPKVGRSAPTRKIDRSSLCSFTFSDGRHCRSPRKAGHAYLCAFHARKEDQALAGDEAGQDITRHLSGGYVSACDLSSAHGHVKSKTASTLAYLGQTLVQTLHLAQHEYINAFGSDVQLPNPARLRPLS